MFSYNHIIYGLGSYKGFSKFQQDHIPQYKGKIFVIKVSIVYKESHCSQQETVCNTKWET